MTPNASPRPAPAPYPHTVSTSRVFTPILIIDDHEMFSTVLTLALRSHKLDARQLTGTDPAATILAQIQHLPPGLVLLDPRLGHDQDGHPVDGVGLVRPLCAHGWAVVVLSDSRDEARIAAAIAAGAIGSLAKSAPFHTLLDTLRAAAAGEPLMTDPARQRWLQHHYASQNNRRRLTQRLDRLSPREREVLDLLSSGQRAPDIAAHFVVALTTVRTQIRAILTKLEVNSQLEAVALTRRHLSCERCRALGLTPHGDISPSTCCH